MGERSETLNVKLEIWRGDWTISIIIKSSYYITFSKKKIEYGKVLN